MDKTKLTVRVKKDLLENLKRFAAANNTTLTGLIDAYLVQIPKHSALLKAPTVLRLSGILSAEVSTEDYRKYLDQKYAH